jgi:hypothetical protein
MEPYRLGTGGCRNLNDQELRSNHNQMSLGSNQGAENVLLMTFVDRLCGLVVSVEDYKHRGSRVRFPGTP